MLCILLLASCASSSEVLALPSATPLPIPTAVAQEPTATPTNPISPITAVREAAPSPEVGVQAAEAASTVPTAEPEAEPPQAVEHKVQAGEALLGLALDYGVPMAAIQLENEMGDGISLWAGEVLVIPPAAAWEGASPYWLLHKVETGDTLGGIATTYDVALDRVWAVNGLESDMLAVDQLLVIPLEGPADAFMRVPASPGTEGSETTGQADSVGSIVLPPAAPLPADIAAWPAAMYERINQARAAHGLYPLAYNGTLAWAAQLHAQDCDQRGWCSHTGSDGSSVEVRILRAGYPAAGTAECWVQAATPERGFEFWYYETPPYDAHRRTLLSSYLTEVGIGIVATDWGYYFVADFGRP